MEIDYIENQFNKILSQFKVSCEEAGRPVESVQLLPVTKRQPLEKLQTLYSLGLKAFGENRVQEMLEKAALLPEDIQWHMIGHLQKNKVRQVVSCASFIHAVDSIELMQRIDRISAESGKVMKIFLQVNISGEASKSGMDVAELDNVVEASTELEHIELIGLMTMPPLHASDLEVTSIFAKLKNLRDRLQEQCPGLKELSMGMSNDFHLAIAQGATVVRIGSLLLGERLGSSKAYPQQ